MTRPLILMTNDDGIYAPGIQHLWNSVRHFADVIIVAPTQEQSGVSMSLTLRQPISFDRFKWCDDETQAWALRGTPADCVKIAMNVIVPRKPALVLSGINRGNNAGRNVLYSGTVAAVIEGIQQNVPGIAFSIDEDFHPNYAAVEALIPQIVHYTLHHPLPAGTFLNVNFPKHTAEGIKGIKLTRQGREFWREDPQERIHPSEGKSYYWIGRKLAQFEEEEDSDIMWLRKGYAAAVPIHIGEMTNHTHLNHQKDVFHRFVNT